jgi:ribosomal protein S18 acetylase RimI-like enzyme
MNFRIETVREEHIPAIVGLMREFADYEKLSDFLEITEEKLFRAMFGEGGFVEGLIAVGDGGEPVGYALFFLNFSSFRGQIGVYLEDIFIRESHRKSGLGEMMLRQTARIGKQKGAERMDFQVLDWNAPAIAFYRKHGAVMDSSERHFKFTDQAFEDLASGN